MWRALGQWGLLACFVWGCGDLAFQSVPTPASADVGSTEATPPSFDPAEAAPEGPEPGDVPDDLPDPPVPLQFSEVTLQVLEDAPIAGGESSNQGDAPLLRLTGTPNRDALLKFDLTGVEPSELVSADLVFLCEVGVGQGTVHALSDSTWEEDVVVSSNAPPLGELLGQLDCPVVGSTAAVDLTDWLTLGEVQSVRLTADSPYDFRLSSREGSVPPHIVLRTH